MTSSTLTLLVATIAALTLNLRTVTSEDDPRLEEELKCLNHAPTSQCDLEVTYPAPVNKLTCDQLITDSQHASLRDQPAIKVPELNSTPTEGLLVMFDPDAPMSTEPADGFLHWLTQVVVNDDRSVSVKKTITDYYNPNPPTGDTHRYQFLLFNFGLDKTVSSNPGRKFRLCPFMNNNSLAQPVVTFQFLFKS